MTRPLRRALTLTLTSAVALALAGCAATAMNVSSHVERGLDFGSYKTFAWGPADALPTGDPRLDKDPFFKDYFEGAIQKNLVKRGLTLAASSSQPDLLIHYHATIAERLDVDRVDRDHGYCASGDCAGEFTRQYEAGTLVIDIIDARANKLIWRGWAQDSVEGILNNPDKMVGLINEAVTRMLERLPK